MLGNLNLMVGFVLLRNVKRQYVGWTLLIYSAAATAAAHVYSMCINYAGPEVKVTGVLMGQTFFLSFIGWDWYDGSDDKKGAALTKFPSLLEYLAAGFCPSQCISGPVGHFKDFYNYIKEKEGYKDIPSTIRAGMGRIAHCALWLFIWYSIKAYAFTIGLHSDKYKQLTFMQKVF